MRILFVLLISVVTGFSVLPVASADERAATDLLSYAELMQLPAKQRAEYIDGVRAILIDLSRESNGRFSDSDPAKRSRLKAWLEWLETEMKSARAEPTTKKSKCSDNAECAAVQKTCLDQGYKLTTGPSGELTCDTSRKISVFQRTWLQDRQNDPRATVNAVPSTRPIVITNDGGTANVGASRDHTESAQSVQEYVNIVVSGSNRYQCRSKYQSVSGPGGANLPECDPSTEKKIEDDFKKSRSKISVLSMVKKSAPAAATETTSSDATNPVPASTEAAPLPVSKPDESAATSEPSADVVTAPVAPPPPPIELKAPPAAVTLQAPAGEASAESPMPIAIRPRAASKAAEKSTEEVVKPKKRAPSAAKASSKYTCAPTPKVCGDVKESRKKIFQGNLSCVFAGMVSQLDSQNRKCQAVTEFKVGESTFKCASGQTMCNPLLFGTVSPTTPICVGRGNDVTEQCSKLSSARDAEKFLNRNVSGLQDRWDEFRKDLEKVCKDGTTQAAFHCHECNIIQARLFELHARILADPCRNRTRGEDAVDARIRIRSAPTTK